MVLRKVWHVRDKKVIIDFWFDTNSGPLGKSLVFLEPLICHAAYSVVYKHMNNIEMDFVGYAGMGALLSGIAANIVWQQSVGLA